MSINYFAGSVFTTQEVLVFGLAAFAILGILVGLIIFVSKKLLDKTQKEDARNKLNIGKSLAISFGFIAAIVLLFFVAPTMVKNGNWNKKQQSCARETGYASPADDNSSLATADSQDAYRRCLDL